MVRWLWGGLTDDHGCDALRYSPDYDAIKTKQLSLAHKHPMAPFIPPSFTSGEIATAALVMYTATVDTNHRIVIRSVDGALYIALKFYLPVGNATLMSRILLTHDMAERAWGVIKREVESEDSCSANYTSQRIILTGYGWAGSMALLLAVRLARLPGVSSVRLVTFDDPLVILDEPATNSVFLRLQHLRFLLDSPSSRCPFYQLKDMSIMAGRYRPFFGDPCSNELLLDTADTIRLDQTAMEQARSFILPQGLSHILHLPPRGTAHQSVGTREVEAIEDGVRLAHVHRYQSPLQFFRKSFNVLRQRADEAAQRVTTWLRKILNMEEIECKQDGFTIISSSFTIECKIGRDGGGLANDALFLSRYTAQLLITGVEAVEIACRQMAGEQDFKAAGATENCIEALIETNQEKLMMAIDDCVKLKIDQDRLTAVLSPQEPLKMGAMLLKHAPATFARLLGNSSDFPKECKGIITGTTNSNDIPLWQAAQSFVLTLSPDNHVRRAIHPLRLASKRDSDRFNVKRVSFNLDGVGPDARLVSPQALAECLAAGKPTDCTQPVNRWLRPRFCPQRCDRHDSELCKEVRRCGRGWFVAVQSKGWSWGGVDDAVKARGADRYIAYEVQTRKSWGRTFYVLLSYD